MLCYKKMLHLDRAHALKLHVEAGVVQNNVLAVRRGDIVTRIHGFDVPHTNWMEAVATLSYHSDRVSVEVLRKTKLGRFLSFFECLTIKIFRRREIHSSLVERL